MAHLHRLEQLRHHLRPFLGIVTSRNFCDSKAELCGFFFGRLCDGWKDVLAYGLLFFLGYAHLFPHPLLFDGSFEAD